MKIDSTYEFIRYLLETGKPLSFRSSAFSHGQGAELIVEYGDGNNADKAVGDKISFPIFELMMNYLLEFPLDWVEDFVLAPRLSENGDLVFDSTFFYAMGNYWNIYDPIYQNCILDVRENLNKSLEQEFPGLNFDVDWLSYSASLELENGVVRNLEANANVDQDFIEDMATSEYQQFTDITGDIDRLLKTIFENSINELRELVKVAGISEYELTMKIDEPVQLVNGVKGYEEYTSSYFAQIGTGLLKEKLLDGEVYEF